MDQPQASFTHEVDRVRESGAVGQSGRLRDLFDFLASRGPEGEPATQADIAETVFGQHLTETDDATVRVYVHRLRKRLDQFNAGRESGTARLAIPAGAYALRLQQGGAPAPRGRGHRLALSGTPLLVGIVLALALAGAFLAGRGVRSSGTAPAANAIWQPFVASERPIVIVVGDYYIFGHTRADRPEVDRMIRDFAINSKDDLERAQDMDPSNYANTEDMGLTYLPVSTAHALRALVPVLAQGGKRISVVSASEFHNDVFRTSNVIYVGLLSGMGMLQDVNFTDSNFAVGESFDDLIDMESGRHYVSGEPFALPTTNYYQDYGYVARFSQPGGALVGVLAGERDTGLRGVAPLAVAEDLADPVRRQAAKGSFEALYQITGQQGADLGEKLVDVRARP